MPGLLSPPDGSTFDSGVVNLVWTASNSPDVAGYRINLSGLIIEVGDETQYTTNALPNGTYTWQVAAFDGAGNSSAYTAPWSFAITDLEPPEPPNLVSPEHGSVITVNNAILLWDPSPSPDVAGYRLDFNGELIDIRSGISFATGALENGTYSWRVAAYDGADNLSEFTPEWQFTIDVSDGTNLIPVADAGGRPKRGDR
jgi:endoglucanase